MSSIKFGTLILLLLTDTVIRINKMSADRLICQKTQITVRWANGTIQCSPCPVCRRGWGSTYSCGDVVDAPPAITIKCVKCKKRQTFSPDRSTDTCKKCTSCKPKQEIEKKCTRSADTLCGGCKKGYYSYQDPPSFTFCEKCSPCCGDSKDTRIDKCEKDGLSINLQCGFLQERNCNQLMSSIQATNPKTSGDVGAMEPTSPAIRNISTQPTTESKGQIREPTAMYLNINNNVNGSENGIWPAIIVGVILIFLVLCVIYLCLDRRSNRYQSRSVKLERTADSNFNVEIERRTSQEPDDVAATERKEQQQAIASAQSRPLKEFIYGQHERSRYNEYCWLMNTISNPKNKKHFYSIATRFGIDYDTSSKLSKDKRGQTQALLDYLYVTKEIPTKLEEVACVLDGLGREREARILREEDVNLQSKAREPPREEA